MISMMPAQPTGTLAYEEARAFEKTEPATVVTVAQESAPIGSSGSQGFHVFTVSLTATTPPGGIVAPQTAAYTFTAGDNWIWQPWANYYWYDDKRNLVVSGITTVTPTIQGNKLTIAVTTSLNTVSADTNRLAITLMAYPTPGASSGTTKGKVEVNGSKPFPASGDLAFIVT
ncbi:hypothetical protein ACIRRH_10990 [Kitasatospora sp. NPDC101235]|uniref:hypothetical protein n=1 Tax=Kitasatospora sp. NPDC101235 TaxID=3364101 RepID=UPI0038160F68